MKGLNIALSLALVFFPVFVYGYEIGTHKDLSANAAKYSVLGKDQAVLQNIGVKKDQKYPGSDGFPRPFDELFKVGAEFEDNSIRPLNHFYDPLHDNGIAFTSPTWTLEDKREIPAQNYSWRDAREYFYKALTSTTKTDRDKHFGLTFETLGHVIHHVQDMAQPQHVRLDYHLNLGWTNEELPFENRSRYEEYTQHKGSNLPFNGYDPVKLDTVRQFWASGDGRGMAEFTNANFVSKDTNFRYAGGKTVATARYPSPVPNGWSANENIDDLFTEVNEKVPAQLDALCTKRGRTCVMTFYATTVTDKNTGATTTNYRASTASIFDQDLKAKGKAITYVDPDTNESVVTGQLFSLNRFNFDAAHKFLIPRAVGYSAGVINYFFRGVLSARNITVGRDASGIQSLTYRIRNDTNYSPTERMAGGSFVMVASYKLGGSEQYVTSNTLPWGNALAPGDVSPETFAFTFKEVIPAAAKDVEARVIFRGSLGGEQEAVAVGLVPISSAQIYDLSHHGKIPSGEDWYGYFQVVDQLSSIYGNAAEYRIFINGTPASHFVQTYKGIATHFFSMAPGIDYVSEYPTMFFRSDACASVAGHGCVINDIIMGGFWDYCGVYGCWGGSLSLCPKTLHFEGFHQPDGEKVLDIEMCYSAAQGKMKYLLRKGFATPPSTANVTILDPDNPQW